MAKEPQNSWKDLTILIWDIFLKVLFLKDVNLEKNLYINFNLLLVL